MRINLKHFYFFNRPQNLLILGLIFVPFVSGWAETLLEKNRALLHNGQTKEAIESLTSSLETYPDDLDLRCMLAQALAWENDFESSENEYEKVLSKEPHYHDALVGLARLRLYQRKPAKAVEIAQKGLAAHPESPEMEAVLIEAEGWLESPCPTPSNYVFRGGYEYEDYSYTRGGAQYGASVQNRNFHGADLGVGAQVADRFEEKDVEFHGAVGKRLFGSGMVAIGEAGFSSKQVLFPKYKTFGTLVYPIHSWGIGLEGRGGVKKYVGSDIYEWGGGVWITRFNLTLDLGAKVTHAFFDQAGSSGGLASWDGRLTYDPACWWRVWVGGARTKEAFEPGRGLAARNFKANHVSVGARIHMTQKVFADFSYARETRPDLNQHVTRVGGSFGMGF